MENKPNNQKRSSLNPETQVNSMTGRYLWLCLLIAVVIPVSIAELHTDNGLWWGIATAFCVNGSALLWSIITLSEANRGQYDNKTKEWRRYYEYWHFPVEIVFVLIGFFILSHFNSTWVLILNLLTGSWPIVGGREFEELIS